MEIPKKVNKISCLNHIGLVGSANSPKPKQEAVLWAKIIAKNRPCFCYKLDINSCIKAKDML